MYNDIVSSYASSMHAIKAYVSSVEELVGEGDQLINGASILVRIMWIAKLFKEKGIDIEDFDFAKTLPEDIDVPEGKMSDVKRLMRDLVEAMSEQLVVSEDGKTATYGHMSKDIKEQFIKIEAEKRKPDLLYSGSLMLLVTYFENLVSKVIKEDLKLHPQRMSLENKQVPYSMLEKANDISDIKNMLIDEEVSALMYQSLKDWIEYLSNKVKLKQNYIRSIQEKLKEIIVRRNIIVHNEGIVNSIYLTIVDPMERKNIKQGDTLEVDEEYLNRAIDIIELSGMALAIEAWIKECGSNEDEMQKIANFIYDEYLIFERWEEAKTLYEICLECKKLKDADKLLCQINRWQCFKWQERFDEVVDEVKEFDISATGPEFTLGILALLDKYDEFFSYFDSQNVIKETHLQEWPLFKNIRETQMYIDRYSKKKTKNNK